MAAVIELQDVGVYYGTVRALDGVTLAAHRGEVLGVVGDNGAGKSTLLKVISGLAEPTRGRLLVEDRPVTSWTTSKAREAGIEVVYQDLALVEELPLWRNFFLGKEPGRNVGPLRFMSKRDMRRICAEQLKHIGLTRISSVDVEAGLLSGGERQSLAITRATYFGAKALLLDEPTAALAVRETERVFRAIQEAKRRNLAVIYIDHNMAHVHPIADRIAVVSQGKVARILKRNEVTLAELLEIVSADVEAVAEEYVTAE